ncbi:MAG: aspartate--tRNA(Asn) ligase [Patescibacteria group bacterium]|jgi:aspartyl-tRNA synthetase
MKNNNIDSINKIGKEIILKGWVNTIRKMSKMAFVDLRDRSGIVQVVLIPSELDEASQSIMAEIKPEYVLEISGIVNKRGEKQINKNEPAGEVEILAKSIKILSEAETPLPIPITNDFGNEAEFSTRLDWRWIDLRDPKKQNIFKVWTALEQGCREYFAKENFTQIYTPSFMSAPSESGAEVFTVKYFDRQAYLAQSPQFYKQMAMAAGMEKVFVNGPVFRAEPSFTSRHMTEFTGWDFEISFIESHYDVMAAEEQMLIAGFKQVKAQILPDLEIPIAPFPKIGLKEAKEKLLVSGITSEKADDLSPEEERGICEIIKKETGSDFVFITDYPISVRPFYHMRHENDNSLTKSFDLLYKGIEITTGAQREHRVEILEAQAKEKGMDLASLKDYINFFRFGCPPHGGVGIGPGRIIMSLLDLPNVKEVTFLPRDVKRLTP